MARGPRTPTEVDPQVEAAKINRNSAIIVAAITATLGLIAAVITYVVGHQQGVSSAATTTTVTVTADAGTGNTTRPGDVTMTADKWTGSAWSIQDITVGGKSYPHTSATTLACNIFTATYSLYGQHPKYFSVGIGIDDSTPHQSFKYTVELDGEPTGSQGTLMSEDRLKHLTVTVGEAKSVSLYLVANACQSTLVATVNPVLTDTP
jgi:hypothetical protein